MNRYETNSKGTSPALSSLINQFANMPRSAFDETRRKLLDASPYAIIPIECFLMFPNSEAYLNYDISAITKNPTIRRMLSSMNIETRTYLCKCSDLWEGWNNFITRGRSGKVDLSIPTLDFYKGNVMTALPYNPAHYLNITPAVKYAKSQSFFKNQAFQDITETETVGDETVSVFDDTGLLGENFQISSSVAYKASINALPFVMYCKIAKEYQNSNLLQDNPHWYPENENHDLILPYNCSHASNASYDDPTVFYGDTVDLPDGTQAAANVVQPDNSFLSYPWLNVLYYRQRKGNYYNTGSPFPDLIRGDVPTLDLYGANADFSNAVMEQYVSEIPALNVMRSVLGVGYDSKSGEFRLGALEGQDSSTHSLETVVQKPKYTSGSAVEYLGNGALETGAGSTTPLVSILNKNTIKGIQFNMNAWRRLSTMTVFKERMARTDGSYNQMIQSQFMYNPRWHEHSVRYCGGSSQPLVFSEVVQTSEDGNTPLGNTAGRAVSSSGGNQVTIRSDDYSILMTVLTITPDDYYSQGIDRMWSELTQSEQYFPILNNLEPQAIKNKELFVSGTDSDDEDVFNYQELFSHFKSRQNQVSGLMSLPISKVGDTGAYLFNRLFTSTPKFNNAFVTGKFSDNENLCFASTEQAQFALSIVSSMKYVAPIPAVTQPSDMGISY